MGVRKNAKSCASRCGALLPQNDRRNKYVGIMHRGNKGISMQNGILGIGITYLQRKMSLNSRHPAHMCSRYAKCKICPVGEANTDRAKDRSKKPVDANR
jgi:hypothetical protein